MYYLQSRYYDPQTGRFLNGDDSDNVGISRTTCSHCLFAYCENNSINDTDHSGFFSWAIFGDMIKRIASFVKELLSFVLGKYGLSKKAYAKRTKYKEPSALLSYVNANKSSIKNVRNNASSVSAFMNVLLTVADCASILRNNRSVLVKIADLLFYGVIRLLGYLGGKLISWIISKVCAALFWARFIIEQLLKILWDWLLNSKWVDKLRNKFLQYVDSYSMTFGGYVVALFKVAKACIA